MTLEIELLRTLLRYEPETGRLFWLERDVSLFEGTQDRTAEHLCNWWNSRFSGQEALTALGGNKGWESRCGRIFGKPYSAATVIYALCHGEWPKMLDHIDGDRLNNRIENLRCVTHQENMQNKRVYKSSKTGHHGVSFDRGKGKYRAYITVNGKRMHIGYYGDAAAAIAARERAERQHGCFHQNHGRAA